MSESNISTDTSIKSSTGLTESEIESITANAQKVYSDWSDADTRELLDEESHVDNSKAPIIKADSKVEITITVGSGKAKSQVTANNKKKEITLTDIGVALENKKIADDLRDNSLKFIVAYILIAEKYLGRKINEIGDDNFTIKIDGVIVPYESIAAQVASVDAGVVDKIKNRLYTSPCNKLNNERADSADFCALNSNGGNENCQVEKPVNDERAGYSMEENFSSDTKIADSTDFSDVDTNDNEASLKLNQMRQEFLALALKLPRQNFLKVLACMYASDNSDRIRINSTERKENLLAAGIDEANFDCDENGEEFCPLNEEVFAALIATAKSELALIEACTPSRRNKLIQQLMKFTADNAAKIDKFYNLQYLPMFPALNDELVDEALKVQDFINATEINNDAAKFAALSVGTLKAVPFDTDLTDNALKSARERLSESDFTDFEKIVRDSTIAFQSKLADAANNLRQAHVISDKTFWDMTDRVIGGTNTDFAKRFLIAYGDCCRYVYDLKRWLLFDVMKGWYMSVDDKTTLIVKPFLAMLDQYRNFCWREVNRIIKNHADLFQRLMPALIECKQLPNNETCDALRKRAESESKENQDLVAFLIRLSSSYYSLKEYENRHKYNAAIKTAGALEYISSNQTNNQPSLLAVQNGIVNLHTGEILPFSTDLLITQKANAEYRRGYRSEAVEKFLRQILPNNDTRRAVIRFLAYCLTGYNFMQQALFFYGTGSNGKSTLAKLLQETLGTFATSLKAEILMKSQFPRDGEAPSPSTADLFGKRLAVVSESHKDRALDEEKFKSLTGGDFIKARQLHSGNIEFENIAKLVICGNYLPRIADADDFSITRRIMIAPFTQTFKDSSRNNRLMRQLETDEARTGFLSLLIDECAEFLRDEILIESDQMKETKQNWLDLISGNVADISDLPAFRYEFLTRFCKRQAGAAIARSDFLKKFRYEYKINATDNQIINSVIDSDKDTLQSPIEYKRRNLGYAFVNIAWKTT